MRCAEQFRAVEHPSGGGMMLCRRCGERSYGAAGHVMAWMLLHECDEDDDTDTA